jgi:glycosyltransferase involved in cell wall biosynthesis
MRVLAHIHTFNDVDVIDRTIDAVRRQTRPVDGILIVDNASRDGTPISPRTAATFIIMPAIQRSGR